MQYKLGSEILAFPSKKIVHPFLVAYRNNITTKKENRFEISKWVKGISLISFFFFFNKNEYLSDRCQKKKAKKKKKKEEKNHAKKVPIKNESLRERRTVSITV